MDSIIIDFSKVIQEADKGIFDTLYNALKQAYDDKCAIFETVNGENDKLNKIPRTGEKSTFYFIQQKKNHRYLLKRIVQEKQLNIIRLMWLYNEDFMADWVDICNEFTFSHNNTDFYNKKFDIIAERLGKQVIVFD